MPARELCCESHGRDTRSRRLSESPSIASGVELLHYLASSWRERSSQGDQQVLKRRGRWMISREPARRIRDRVVRAVLDRTVAQKRDTAVGLGSRSMIGCSRSLRASARREAGFSASPRTRSSKSAIPDGAPSVGRDESVSAHEHVGRPTFTSYICQVPQDQDFRATSGAAHYRRVPS